MSEQPPSLPHQQTAADLDFHEHEWVSPACIHRRHSACELGCPLCNSECLCVCHRWKIPIHGQPIVYR